ncbi:MULTISPECIES: AI-2E family transporter [unclassified Lactococcus]|uniref:AI-2E family transporter n=1 Tax=unclassified Lactococcus TaxID=2643510 RepID=UPI0011C95DE1|nr:MULTISPECIES: AI-2E family transporter [unclassified Lactococcus]MQW23365.1 AI-2E family transporter [Lactococcus sp. dk101]TXK37934.1 AI-2E family transporter [Lactococcus sp. dk310]TXK49588.1 AI-2E family transporter [Lactococcus sp. dk322]
MKKENKPFSSTVFMKWIINNKIVTILTIILLFLLNIFVLSKVEFIFQPVNDFLAIIGLPIVLAAVFYYLLNPVVDFAQKHKVPRVVSIAVLFILIAALIVWGLVVAIPNISSGIESFASNVPIYVNDAQKGVNSILENPHFEQLKPQVDKIASSLGSQLIDWSKTFSSTALDTITGLIGKTTSVVISLIVFPFVLFYLLKDGKKLNGYVTHLLPKAWRKDTSDILHEINSQLSNYVRGQIIVAFSVAVMFLIGLPLIGLKYGVALAIMSGFFNLIPFLGFYLAIVPALIIAMVTGGPIMLVKVIIVYTIEQTIEGRLISPLVLGKSLTIHPITVLFALLTSAKIWGVWGVLLGIPLYATAKVVIVHIFEWYKQISELYPDDPILELSSPDETSMN